MMENAESDRVPTKGSQMGYYDLPHETDGGGSVAWLTIKAVGVLLLVVAFIGYVLL